MSILDCRRAAGVTGSGVVGVCWVEGVPVPAAAWRGERSES